MYTYPIRQVNSRLYEITLKVELIERIYLQIHLVNSRCLHETTFKVEVIVRVCLPSPPSQLALFVRDSF